MYSKIKRERLSSGNLEKMKYSANKPIMRALKFPVFMISELKYSVVLDAMALMTGIASTK